MIISNSKGRSILLNMVKAIQDNKQLLGDVDGLIGDGDHGMNMNKGFSLFQEQLGDAEVSFSDGLFDLGRVLMNQIGGSMGPIYGTFFMEMSDRAGDADAIDLRLFTEMLDAGLSGLYDIVDARVGDKTIIDTLYPAVESLKENQSSGSDFITALKSMKSAATRGKDSTIGLVAKYGRSARLGERSRGILDAGATSCCIILHAMADGMLRELEWEG